MQLHLEPLTPQSFAQFGTVIANPARHGSSVSPAPKGISANQGTATKYSPIAPLVDAYRDSSRGMGGEARFSMFVCEPRQLQRGNTVTQAVLERHPYTTQAFIPMGLDSGQADHDNAAFVVIVAPGTTKAKGTPCPDVRRARAFLAPAAGDMAVNYAANTWHAPMIVVGERAVEFVVVQFVNGVSEDDCVEYFLEGDEVLSVGVSVALDFGRRRRMEQKL